jgi:hypothetical protein
VWDIAADAGTSGTAGTAGSGGANGANGTNGSAGANGGPGPGVVFRGEYVGGETYFFTATRRDIVKSAGTFYLFATSTTDTGTTSHSTPPSANWTAFGAQFSSVATDILLAQDVFADRTVNIGADGATPVIALNADHPTNANPFISIGQISQGFGNAGIFLGYDGGVGKVSVDNGLIGGWTIDSNKISKTSAAGAVEINSSDLGFFIKDTNSRNAVIMTDDVSFRITGSTAALTDFSGTSTKSVSGPRFGENLQSEVSTTFSSSLVSTGAVVAGTEISIAGSEIATLIANSSPTSQWLDRGAATFVQTYHWISLEVVGVGQALMASGYVFWDGSNYQRRFTSTGGASLVIPSTGTYNVQITHQIGVNYLISGESITLKTPDFTGINAVKGDAPRSVEINQAGLQSLYGSNQFKVDTSLNANAFLTVRGKSEFSGSSNFTSLNASEGNITNLTVGSISISDGVFTINGDIRATGDIYALASSDERLKENVIPISNPMDKIKKLGGYTFNWNDVSKKPTHIEEIGVIAQEVQQVLPQIVREKGDGFLGVDYEKIVALLIEGVKQQQEEIDVLKNEIIKLNKITNK